MHAVPTIVALRDGIVVFRRAGALSTGTLQSLVDRLRDVVPGATASDTLDGDGMPAPGTGLPST